MPKAKRKGRQEPTTSVLLPYEKSKGREAVTLYNRTGRRAQEWQKSLLYSILGKNKDGLWTHTRFGYSVPRRNGKNEVVAMRELWGLQNGEKILHTAHRTTTSHTAWDRLCSLLDKSKVEYKSIRAMGRENIVIESCDGRIEFRTRSSKGGLGEGFDLLVIDEAQEYTDDQESALKYVVSDSKNPQTVLCGTPPTPVSSGTVFTSFRKNVLMGKAENAGWAEWAVEEMSDVNDRELWYQCNPSLGTILTERAITDEIGPDETDFNIQRLGLWIKYNQHSVITETMWNSLRVETLPEFAGKLYCGVKFSHDGKNLCLSIAVRTTDAKIFVEAIDCRPISAGVGWVLEFLLKADTASVVIDGANGQQLLADVMKEARLKKPVLPKVAQIIAANAAFEQALYQKSLCHAGQPSLSQVASNVDKRPIGSSGGFGYKAILEDTEIALLDSVILAFWACSTAKVPRKQHISY